MTTPTHSQITPGPWNYIGMTVRDSKEQVICTTNPRDLGLAHDWEKANNARAIALVPEMVELLNRAIVYGIDNTWWDRIHALLAKLEKGG